MHKKASIFGIASLLAAPSLAANTVVIEQVGSGSVTVKQSGIGGNSVEIRQSAEDTKAVDKGKFDEKAAAAKKAKKPVDYNKAVINDPTISTHGRAQAIIERNKPAAGNSIKIYQNGDSNKAVTSQEGEDNELQLEQEGKNNEYRREQKGKYNRARIKQNGEEKKIIEENND